MLGLRKSLRIPDGLIDHFQLSYSNFLIFRFKKKKPLQVFENM